MGARAALRRSVRGTWRDERWPLAVIGAGSLVATIAWGAVTRPMGDSFGYRVAGQVITGGWDELTERTPGYPLLLWVTGSLHGETTALFVVQLLLHAAAILLVVRMAGRLGLGTWWRTVIAFVLVLPPPMVKVAYSGSEALSELLVVATVWSVERWIDRRDRRLLVLAGALIGAAAWTRPTFQAMWLPVGLVVGICVLARSGSRATAVRAAATITLPAVLMVAVLFAHNAIRFDSPGLTPLFGWFLGSRTSTFIEELPQGEPARRTLIAERDRRLLLGPETDAENYQFGIRGRLAEVTGTDGTELDAYMFDLNAGLILAHPFEYLRAVSDSATRYVQIDAQPAASGPGRFGGWLQSAAHLLLMAAFLVPAMTVPGLALRGEVSRRMLAVLGCSILVALYVGLISILVQTGSPRLRAPTDPLLVLTMFSGWFVLISRARLGRTALGIAAGRVTR